MTEFILLLPVLSALLSLGRAADPVFPQTSWLYPTAPDNTTAMVNGNTYTLKWKSDLWSAWSQYMPSADPHNSDLWISGYYEAYHGYQHLVASRVDVNASGHSISWTVQVPSTELAQTPYWVFRFVPSGNKFQDTADQQVSSPAVYVAAAGAVVSTTSAGTSASQASGPAVSSNTAFPKTTIGGTTTATGYPSSTASGATSSFQSGISGGAIGGIVVGAVAGCPLLIGLGWYLSRSRKSKSNYQPYPMTDADKNDNTTYPEVVVLTSVEHNTERPGTNQRQWNDALGYGYNNYNTQPVHEMGNGQGVQRAPAELSGTDVPRRPNQQ